ncbi:FMN-binding protein [Microbacterium sp.]|uniref:FMN-binding protein n=1 Tax=Microbacterium sp. TaxID=51671 RepID=UPI00333FF85B
MKRIVYAVLATLSGLVLLFSYRTSHGENLEAPSAAPGASTTGASGASSGSQTSSGTTGAGSSGATGTGGSATLKDGSYTGDAAQTRYGPVQVRVTVSSGRFSAVDVVEYPNDNPRDQQINRSAVPQLVSETLSAQSSSIDMVSGATYTSDGYLQSLQSAIDQARS